MWAAREAGGMMSERHCLVERDGRGVVRLTIREAGRANVLRGAVIEDLTTALAGLAAGGPVRVVVLASSGDGTFTGGADLAEMAALDAASAPAFIRRLAALCEAVRTCPAPVVARIAGACLGGGLELAAACDVRVAATGAWFAMPEVRMGIPSVIHAALLPRLIGGARARWLMLTGEAVDAATALGWGLVDRVVGVEALDAAVAGVVDGLLACGPAVLASQKALLRAWEELPLREAIEGSVAAFAGAFATGEPGRAMGAFLARKAGTDDGR